MIQENKSIKSSYTTYKNTTEEPISKKDYEAINKLYMLFLINKVSQGNEVTLPARLGTLRLKGVKERVKIVNGIISGLAPDWVATRELWKRDPEAKKQKKRVFHINTHSDGIRYRWHWSKLNVLVTNKTLYSLRMSRDNKRLVPKLVKNKVDLKVERL